MEIKDILPPVFTVIAVCLAANFALRNERRKKALEIETAQIDRLSALTDRSLDNFSHYAGALAAIVDIKITMMQEHSYPEQPTNLKVDLEKLHEWRDEVDTDPVWRLDMNDLRQASHGLRFHREADWHIWHKIVPRVHSEIYDFFMITAPGEENIELRNLSRSASEAIAFANTMRVCSRELKDLRETLMLSMSADFRKLLRPEETATFCSLLRNIWLWFVCFIKCRR